MYALPQVTTENILRRGMFSCSLEVNSLTNFQYILLYVFLYMKYLDLSLTESDILSWINFSNLSYWIIS